jgi:hypothetical protein
LRVSHDGGNGNFNFSTKALFTPDVEAGTDPLGSFIHSWETEMAGTPAFAKYTFIDAFSVISDAEFQNVLFIRDFNFNGASFGMLEGVVDRFSADAK